MIGDAEEVRKTIKALLSWQRRVNLRTTKKKKLTSKETEV
jgi:hypothetical protein